MLHDSPLRAQHVEYARASSRPVSHALPVLNRPGAAVGRRADAQSNVNVEYVPYGVADDAGGPTCELVARFGDVEPEYAAIRRGAGLLDSPHRGTLLVTGKDRREFLNRMLTQELKDFAAGMARQSFWLNRKGRIDADMLLIELGDRMLIDLDIHQAAGAVKTLGEFLFAEDVEIKDVSAEFHHIAVHGRLSAEVLAAATGDDAFSLAPGQAKTVTIDGIQAAIARRDQTGEPGFEVIVPYGDATRVWEFLVATDHPVGGDKRRVRPVGWHAFNIARIEAGTPLFNIDFGNTNLPHESGILRQRVSFTKGCYLGQEIVARMESLGKPKQMLIGLRVQQDLLPVAGGQVFARNDDGSMAEEIGVVTSSTLSPMLGAAAVAFAMVKTKHAEMGRTVLVNAEGDQSAATIGPLQFWPAPVSVVDAATASQQRGGA